MSGDMKNLVHIKEDLIAQILAAPQDIRDRPVGPGDFKQL